MEPQHKVSPITALVVYVYREPPIQFACLRFASGAMRAEPCSATAGLVHCSALAVHHLLAPSGFGGGRMQAALLNGTGSTIVGMERLAHLRTETCSHREVVITEAKYYCPAL